MSEPDGTPGRHRVSDPGGFPEDGLLVRPYARTRGPAQVSHELALETLVSTTELGRRLSRMLREPYGSACELCVSTVSVAELSAYLNLSIGTARELVEELLVEELLYVHPPVGAYDSEARTEVLGRMLGGLDRL
ncbi:DUF742 domain-containing protein [Amycolatopsis rhabdoformis]|uniref:DUF742 domain-containing protein n=1 Tax=Amycolatopsis rhabdoformis TaxID=1448059 RepID=A0ABZ1I7H4_9PSEU|nr:DUF742 domain-containing protein [Amycolatopsis rhabdoformis]WSE29777.1 DUF742 domain-containing protein [Amycolatopsis rhabdoformis]